jgi:restriction system protein
MAAISIDFVRSDISSSSVNFKYNTDEEFDLYHKFTGLSNGYFDRLKKFDFKINQNWDNTFSFMFPHIKYISGDSFSSYQIIAENLDELSVKVEENFLESILNWNIDFLLIDIADDSNLKLFPIPFEHTKYLSELYSEKLDDNDKWYNLHFKKNNPQIIDELKEKLNLITDDFLNFAKIYDLDNIDIQPPNISFWDVLMGNENKFKNEHLIAVKRYNFLKSKNEINEKFNDKLKSEVKVLRSKISKAINSINDSISEVKTIFESYEINDNLIPFFEKVLEYSVLNKLFNFSFNIGLTEERNHIVVDFYLPNNEEISNVKGYKEFKRDAKIVELYYSEKDYNKLYNTILYSVTFRILNELFLSDYSNTLSQISLNGWVNMINKKNGKRESKCILTLSVSRQKFDDIDFQHVELKSAFHDLKGLAASNLIDFTPVAPIINLNKNDKRFVQSQEVLNKIDQGVNLAAVNWEEFEHLVREVFEKEFAVNGGEVKVTQSSRDGGVDAVAFDPDPIRGGKIVIQSKRYTNVVGVSAIRDLYGTVMNEGATKGIIVTTSYYGNDAYEFAKGKPLTLLDGNNLLSLLQKHGYNARINLVEAKELNNLEKS